MKTRVLKILTRVFKQGLEREKPQQGIRLLVISNSFTPGVKELVTAQSQLYETHVIYIDFPCVLKETYPNTYIRYPIKYRAKSAFLAEMGVFEAFRNIRVFFDMLFTAIKVIKKNEIDIIHAHWTLPSGLLASLVKGRIPLIISVRGLDVKLRQRHRLFQPLVNYALRRAQLIIALGSSLKKEALELGLPPSRIELQPVGVDLLLFKPRDKPEIRRMLDLPHRFTIVYVGSLIKLKRVDRVISICSQLQESFDFTLLILGDGPQRDNLKQFAAGSPYPDNIVFKGQVSYSEMPFLLSSADVLVLLSTREGLPGCIQEAFACGIPVIATKVGGIADIVIDNNTGFLVDDEAEAKERLQMMMTDPKLAREMGENALKYAKKNLSLDRIVLRTDKIYHSEIGKCSIKR
jgi:glycosyltransferase involved in cell wall biosynthesis